MQLIGIGLMLVAVGYVLRELAFGPSSGFVVRVDGTNMRTKGDFPQWLRADLTRLLKDEMKLRAIHIRGSWQRDHILTVQIDRAIPPGDAQRIRNFLKTR